MGDIDDALAAESKGGAEPGLWSTGYKAWWASGYVETKHGGVRKVGEGVRMSIDHVADQIRVSPRLIRAALKVKRLAREADEAAGVHYDDDEQSVERAFADGIDFGEVSLSDCAWVVENVPSADWLRLCKVVRQSRQRYLRQWCVRLPERTMRKIYEWYDLDTICAEVDRISTEIMLGDS